MTTEIMDTLLALKCRNCYGDELLMRNGEGDSPCPDCHHPITKQPTGLLIPELVEKCSGEDRVLMVPSISHDAAMALYAQCCRCSGTGFVPVSEDTALRVALEWLLRNQGEVIVGVFGNGVEFRQGRQGYYISESNESELGEGATPLEALAAAIKASVEAG